MKIRVFMCLVLAAGLSITSACGSSSSSPGNDNGAVDAGTDVQPSPDATAVVVFADQALETCVRSALDKPDGVLTAVDMNRLHLLECQDRAVEKLDGLQYAAQLTDLYLWENKIVDLKPLAALQELAVVQLGRNQIVDVTPLAGLTKLRRLGLALNQIEDITALSALTELNSLNLDHNKLGAGQSQALLKLTKLKWLTLEYNSIPLDELKGLSPLTEAGAQVYSDFRMTTTSLPPPWPAAGSAAARSFSTGTLVPSADSRGNVHFSYLLDGQRHQVRKEFPGRLVVDGREVRYQVSGQSLLVGQRSTTGLELCSGAFAQTCTLAVGIKGPEAMARGQAPRDPVVSLNFSLERPAGSRRMVVLSGVEPNSADKDVMPFALASPNQFDAGSCLFMASTGAMEILINQHTDASLISYDGPTDLSERYLMNAYERTPLKKMPYLYTDLVYIFNHFGGALLNKDYRFTAGYAKQDSSGNWLKADSTDTDAQFTCNYNWIDELPTDWQTKLLATPLAERSVIFVDPNKTDNSVFNVGLMNADVVERVKYELRTKNAPVLVIYNHYRYWHTSVVVGYDDEEATDGCQDVDDMVAYFEQNGATSTAKKIKDHMTQEGGCPSKGMFYVRDSIYSGGTEESTYKYSDDYAKKYSKRIIKHTYGWLIYLANHAYSMHRQ